jgi:formylglycine-generating enzyme required for sulfatase activity
MDIRQFFWLQGFLTGKISREDWSLIESYLSSSSSSFDSANIDSRKEYFDEPYLLDKLGDRALPLRMVKIPAGNFLMGSPETEVGREINEGPQREVTVPSFYMGVFAITQQQYAAIIDSNPSYFAENGANRPVERVAWYDADAFCKLLSVRTGRKYRLPTEAEWEYACRAGTTTPFHFGETLTPELANYNGNYAYGSGPKGEYRQQTTDVGSFPANGFGLYDMHGNVWEWCQDDWHDSYKGAPTDGNAWLNSDERKLRKVLRGGSWYYNPDGCRSATRNKSVRDARFNGSGFRVVCN